MEFKPPWTQEDKAFTPIEQEIMMSLPNKEILELNQTETNTTLCGILDILLAYIYDCRLTQGDPNVESAWTIRTLAASLSWLEHFDTPKQVAASLTHRILVYPYLRNIDLVEQVFVDMSLILKEGKRGILKCLLKVHDIFVHADVFYLFNKLFVTEYCIWIQQLTDNKIHQFSQLVTRELADLRCIQLVRWDLVGMIQDALANETS